MRSGSGLERGPGMRDRRDRDRDRDTVDLNFIGIVDIYMYKLDT